MCVMNLLRRWGSPSHRYFRTLSRFNSTSSSSILRPLSKPAPSSHSHPMNSTDITPGITRTEYVSRRTLLSKSLPSNSITIFPSNSQLFMSEDVPYLYHPNTDLSYIAGITEPGCFLLAETSNDNTRYVLFVEPKDHTKELWDGPSCGTGDDVRSFFGVDLVKEVNQLPEFLKTALPSLSSFHFDASINPKITSSLRQLEPDIQKLLVSKWSRDAPKSFLLNQRLIKSPAEVQLLRQSCQIMSESFNDTISRAVITPHIAYERFIEASLEFGCKTKGASRMAFPSVVASGKNGTILHYMKNDATPGKNDFVMVDAGCEVHGYCSDVSRSWPVSGRFSSAQRDFYDLVLSVQKQCIDLAVQDDRKIGPPRSLNSIHVFAVTQLVDGLRQLGFLKQHSLESAISTGAYSKYFPHATGHYLGMDVHDTHMISKDLPLKEGMVVTIEPGLYCREDDEDAPKAFRGIGMRIEDDVVVGKQGGKAEVLSSDAVKEAHEIENLVGSCA